MAHAVEAYVDDVAGAQVDDWRRAPVVVGRYLQSVQLRGEGPLLCRSAEHGYKQKGV